MAKAFRCDICGEYRDGYPTKIIFKVESASFNDTTQQEDICGYCHSRVNRLFRDIADDYGFDSPYNSDK